MRRRKSVIVELTSLLDVIFIMLFMVMSRNQAATEQAQQDAAQSVAEMQAAVSEYEEKFTEYQAILDETAEERENIASMQSRLESMEQFGEMARIVTVYVYDSGYKRSIKLEANGETAAVDFDSGNMDYAREKFTAELDGAVKDSPYPVFIIFSYDEDKVYRRDYELVTEVIEKVQGGYENVYIKFSDRAD